MGWSRGSKISKLPLTPVHNLGRRGKAAPRAFLRVPSLLLRVPFLLPAKRCGQRSIPGR